MASWPRDPKPDPNVPPMQPAPAQEPYKRLPPEPKKDDKK